MSNLGLQDGVCFLDFNCEGENGMDTACPANILPQGPGDKPPSRPCGGGKHSGGSCVFALHPFTGQRMFKPDWGAKFFPGNGVVWLPQRSGSLLLFTVDAGLAAVNALTGATVWTADSVAGGDVLSVTVAAPPVSKCTVELQQHCGTMTSTSFWTILTVLSWIYVGIHRCRALPSPVCA